MDDSVLNSRLVGYASVQVSLSAAGSVRVRRPGSEVSLFSQAHSSVEKAGLISLVKIRFLPTDEKLSLRGDTLRRAVQEDRRRGLVPFMVRLR